MLSRRPFPLGLGRRPVPLAIEDWATLALLAITALILVFSEDFWKHLPF